MIKNIVFDMGNVLVRFDPQHFVSKIADDPSIQKMLLDQIFGSTDWIRFDGGLLTKEELRTRVQKRLPKEIRSAADTLLDNWYREMSAIPEMNFLAKALKKVGYRLYLLSNAPEDFYRFKEQFPILEQFDGLFVSSDWKMLKPEKEIYRTFYSHFRLNPRECFFIDDSLANIFCGEETGMQGMVFRGDMAVLEDSLKKAGIRY